MRLDKLLELGPAIVEPVPENARANIFTWRGVSIGSLALKLMEGQAHVNADFGYAGMYVTREYCYAQLHARLITNGGPDGLKAQKNFPPADREHFCHLAGIGPLADIPTIVCHFDGIVQLPEPQPKLLYSGRETVPPPDAVFRIADPVPFSAIDVHSLAFLNELLETDISGQVARGRA